MSSQELKQVIVVRTDLKMGKGKLAAQVAHASLQAFLNCKNEEWKRLWLDSGAKKVVLKVKSLKELLEIYQKAKAAGLPVALIIDAGRTQLEPGTITCVGIGPAPSKLIDPITGHLKLL
jgi:PTH2 family peptidyl-tRNA hydrolase